MDQITNFPNCIYGGVFDLANGNDYDEKNISNFLKFAALFFNNMIIVDSWFTTPNPLTTYLKQIIDSKDRSVYNYELVNLLKSGFIKPALRLGDSMYDNWMGNKYGIGVGSFAGFSLEEGKRILDFVENHLPEKNRYSMWPSEMGNAENTEFSKLIYKYIVQKMEGQSIPERIEKSELDNNFHSSLIKHIDLAESLRIDFINLVKTNISNPKFRRGHIEDLIKNKLNAEGNLNIYQYINEKRNSELEYKLAYEILNSVSTIYEVYHSYKFSTIGGLFPYHNSKIIEDGIYDDITTTIKLDEDIDLKKKVVLVEGNLDLSKVSIESIIDFKNNHNSVYLNYQNRLQELLSIKETKEFYNIRNDFVRFIATSFLPEFLKSNQSAGFIKSVTETLATSALLSSGALIGYKYFVNGELITLSNNPLLYIIFGASGVLRSIPYIIDVKEKIKTKMKLRTWEKKNNYIATQFQI